MVKTVLSIEGMMCGMCEAHINQAIRNAFPVKTVKSSYKKGECVILSALPLSQEDLKKVINETGYTLTKIAQS
ncbi:MAG: heavy-metal-associated domain-containing protein [Blautia sp.]|nr:heavy-metal-associated domain-containing protein [Blautia sp.]